MNQLTYLFRSAPHGNNAAREGIDALLAASAYCENIHVFFIGDGVLQLLAGQNPQGILSKHYAPMFKLFELYDVEHIFVCQASLEERGVSQAELLIDAEYLSREQITQYLSGAGKVLTF